MDVVEEEEEVAEEKMTSRRGIGGPKTAAGKAAVRLNAVKHGVLAETPVLPLVESEEKWGRLRQYVLDWCGPEGEFQESLGERVAMLIWLPGSPHSLEGYDRDDPRRPLLVLSELRAQ